MVILLTWGLIGLAALALLVVLALLAPVRVRARIGGGHGDIRVTGLGVGLLVSAPEGVLTVFLFGRRLWSRPLGGTKAKQKPSRPKGAPKKRAEPNLLSRFRLLMDTRPLLRRVLIVAARLMGRLLRAWRLEEGHLALTVGTGNPAHTGILTGYFQAMLAVITRDRKNLTVEWNPDFHRAVFEMSARLTLRIIPIRPVFAVLRALGSLPWLGLWKLKRAWAS